MRFLLIHGRDLMCACFLLIAGPAICQVLPLPLTLGPEPGSAPLEGRAVYWVDPDRTKTPDELERQAADTPWAVRSPGMQHRLDGQALWVRFDAEVRGSEAWYLTIGSSGIDRVQLFHRTEDGRWRAQEAGDSVPVSQWPVPGRVPTFELARPSGKAVSYLVRIEHERVNFGAELTLQSQSRLLEVREIEQFLMGGYFGVAVLLALVALANAATYRDRNFASYATYLIVFTLGQAAYLGVGAQHLWNQALEWNALSTFLLPGLSAVAALWFVQVVTEPARFSRWLNQLVWALILALLVAVILDTWFPSRAILLTRLGLTALSLVLVCALIGLVWRKGDDAEIRIIALGFVPVLVMALFPIARGFGLVPNSLLTRYGLALGAAVEMPILFYALSRRGARRREAQLRASALPHTDTLTGLADRRHLLHRLDAALRRARGQKHPCALLVVRLANYDWILSEYGRDMLDRALVVTASHLRRCAADVDLASRVDERDFALLLEGPANSDQANARAQQVVASGLRPSQALPPELTLRLQVVVAMLPGEQPDAAATLQWTLAAAASVKPDSRKQIRML
ncbi:diguanylate cyclase [Ramlibacter henchirensis]|uniref:Diguanylate cyclase n=1 Tax=Ramlibacter henchirensis TaxID=204072 RepID=A0A4Z0C4A0_9BURK|nr:7TM diverse intracellular signaling domain-containing protein [Ramlibacter henchirensis]TFZ06426.1 diguanylate cyclase [Ramlibacter henchirensis]